MAVGEENRVGSWVLRVERFLDDIGLPTDGLLASGERVVADGVWVFHHHLEHEATHLATLSSFGRIIIEDGDVLCALQQAMEIVGIDAHLVLDCCELVGLTNAMRNERTVVDVTWHHSFIAG